MEPQFYTLADACKLLKVKAHVITYCVATGKVKEPLRIGGRRMFSHVDLAAISEVLHLELIPKWGVDDVIT